MERYHDGDGDVRMKGGGTSDSGEEVESWGTWEELVLACAVKRHGVKDWESVAMEVQGKTSLPQLHTTAYNCKRKYQDLQRRFHQSHDDQDPIPWLHHLKDLRLAQLRQDLHRYDVSILSLQLKVKKLEEEEKDDDPKPDLEERDSKGRTRTRSEEEEEDDKKTPDEPDRFKHENQSVNGSNSTCSKTHEHEEGHNHKKSPTEPDPLPAGSAQPSKGRSDSDDDSDKGSCETVAKKRRRQERGAAASRESGSSEAQSSASLTRKRRRKLELEDQPDERVLGKSQPLAAILQMIRAHQHGSLFQRRLTSQESDKYTNMVRQHVDLETIQTRLQKDSYSTLTFYRDLLLLLSNAVVFFPKSSTESVAAHQLRRLVLNEMKKRNLITRPDPSSGPSDSLPSQTTIPTDSLLAKHKSTAPIIVCRKRSSISSKPSTIARKASTTTDHPAAEAPAAFDIKPPNNSTKTSNLNNVDEDNGSKEKPVTGTRSSRRTTTTHHHDNNAGASSTKKKISSPAETPKAGKKRKTPEPATASDKKRSGAAAAAADFLKRIKRNSPAQQKLKLNGGTGSSTSTRGAEQKKRGANKTDKVKGRVSRQSGGENKKQVKEESSPSKRSIGRPSKRAAETAAAANVVSPKRSRENGGKQQQESSKRPKKRSRR
ncbi:putative transcription factor MYB-related family [Rosa chinensis]|uniref:Putative transcription factor MYB-related family n=1 Tax=Rosa chinensis TaxID=74649 RepID=A0A2P6S6Y0_ROSCH|nr:putative transcription factor MYB-related family [Rosa chinensis]